MFSLNWWEKSHASLQSRGENTWWSGRNLIRTTIKILRKPCCAFPPSRIGQLFYSGTIICKRLTMPGLMGSHELCFGVNILGSTDNWPKRHDRPIRLSFVQAIWDSAATEGTCLNQCLPHNLHLVTSFFRHFDWKAFIPSASLAILGLPRESSNLPTIYKVVLIKARRQGLKLVKSWPWERDRRSTKAYRGSDLLKSQHGVARRKVLPLPA